MKKIYYALLFIFGLNTCYALDSDNKENIVINARTTSESLLYQEMYDMEYNAGIAYWVNTFDNDIGISSTYFIDDIKNYAKCEATIFTKEMSIDDYKTLMTEYYSDKVKSAIRGGLMLKAKSCVKKFLPYLDDKKLTVNEYVSRKCGSTDESSTESEKREWYYCTATILKQFDMCPKDICTTD